MKYIRITVFLFLSIGKGNAQEKLIIDVYTMSSGISQVQLIDDLHTLNKSIIIENDTTKYFTRKSNPFVIESRYLGIIKTSGEREFYIFSTRIEMLRQKSLLRQISRIYSCRIYLYNKDMQYVGSYWLSQSAQLPIYTKNSYVHFKLEDCKKKINFNNGLPRAINLSCTKDDWHFFK